MKFHVGLFYKSFILLFMGLMVFLYYVHNTSSTFKILMHHLKELKCKSKTLEGTRDPKQQSRTSFTISEGLMLIQFK